MSTEMKQTAYADIAAVNEPHMAVLLLMDTSGSMTGKPLEELIRGYNSFLSQTALDELAMKRVDVAVMQFGSEIKVVRDFVPLAKAVKEPELELKAEGNTPMGEAIENGIQLLRDRCHVYNEAGIPYYRPWVLMITDGEPTDDIGPAKTLIRQREDTGRLKFFSVAVNGANTTLLKSLSPRVIEAIAENNFKGIFNWLSQSMSIISASHVDDNPRLPNLPENFQVVPSDW